MIVFLKLPPTKGVMRFGKQGKLSPGLISPFEILERVGEVAYRLALPPQLSNVHNVFHVSMLHKFEPNLGGDQPHTNRHLGGLDIYRRAASNYRPKRADVEKQGHSF